MTTMTSSPMASGFGPALTDRLSGIGAVTSAAIFAAAGLALLGLGMAFPLSVAVVEQHDLPVNAGDLALASSLGALWYLFVGASFANFAASLAILDRLAIGKRLAIIVAGASATLLLALAMTDAAAAASAILGSVAAVYVAALAVSLAVRPN
jgi:hypothetical protein